MIKRITVFCGSANGKEKIYKETATELGKTLGRNKIGLVYGGANVGLMGAVADGALSEGGEVIGILPRFLEAKEVAHKGLTQFIAVDTMHERKAKMNDLSDGVIALPGGLGTMDELFEMLTWAQLGLHKKPIGILNIKNFYKFFFLFFEAMVEQGFVKESSKKFLLVSENSNELLHKMQDFHSSYFSLDGYR